jgi:hypothetical protein
MKIVSKLNLILNLNLKFESLKHDRDSEHANRFLILRFSNSIRIFAIYITIR